MYEVKDTSAGRCLICGCTVRPWELYCRHCIKNEKKAKETRELVESLLKAQEEHNETTI